MTWLRDLVTAGFEALSMLMALVVGAVPLAAAGRGETAAPTVAAREATLPSGVRLHYREQGPANGPVVLLLHGFTDSSHSFSRVMPLLPATVRVIAPDQRGHGLSDRPAAGYAVDDFARDALQLMDALGVKSATVVGHSMGSFVARRLAERAPSRVKSLVLVGSGPHARNAVVQEVMREVEKLTDPVDLGFVRAFQESTVARPVPAAFMEGVFAASGSVPARVWKEALAGLLAHQPGPVPPLCPTLVLGGTEDSVFSKAEQEQLAATIPGATLDLVDGVGHSLNWEDPEYFVAALQRALAR